jgi:molybdate transport system substrate-binding protein
VTRLLPGLLACMAAALIAACSSAEPDPPNEGEAPVVLAAASLQESLTEAAENFAAEGNPKPVLSFAASSALARQAMSGEGADLFLPADQAWMDRLEQDGLLQPDSRRDLLTNRLVVVAPVDWTSPGRDPFDGGGRIAVADLQGVPAGRYARAALESIGRLAELEPRLIPAENVRAALALVERGQVDRAIVYATDAEASREVEVVYLFPESSHSPIRYPAAILAGSKNPNARSFLEYLDSLEGRAIFRRYGFGIAR